MSPEAALKMFKSNGGPFHPHEYTSPDGGTVCTSGLTIRDWFAGQAVAAIIVADGAQYSNRHEDHARTAYALADAMLAERQKP